MKPTLFVWAFPPEIQASNPCKVQWAGSIAEIEDYWRQVAGIFSSRFRLSCRINRDNPAHYPLDKLSFHGDQLPKDGWIQLIVPLPIEGEAP